MDVRLAPVGPELRERLLALAPRPEQERFSGRLTETLPAAEADPDREPVAILDGDEPVGFFVLHCGPAAGDLAPERRDVLLRAFLVDAAAQAAGSRPARSRRCPASSPSACPACAASC